MAQAGLQKVLVFSRPAECCFRVGEEFRFRLRSKIGELMIFDVTPDVFDRIQFWSVRRQLECLKFPMSLEPSVNFLRPVRAQPIPDHEDVTMRKIEFKLFEKGYALGGSDIFHRMESEDEPLFSSLGRRRETSDGRNLSVRSSFGSEHRSFAFRRPRAFDERREKESCFVDENYDGIEFAGFFLMRGKSFLTHSRMRLSSRSSARFVGRCALQPMRAKRRTM